MRKQISQYIAQIVLGGVSEHDISHSFRRKSVSNGFGHSQSVAVHRPIDDGNSAVKRFIAAETVVDARDPVEMLAPYRTVGRTDGAEFQAPELFDRPLNKHTVFADDIAVIPDHLGKITLNIHITVDYRAVERSETTEGVTRENGLFLPEICHHGFRPVHHGGHDKTQGRISAERQNVVFLDSHNIIRHSIEALDHRQSLSIADYCQAGEFLTEQSYRTGVIRFHMVDYKIVGLAAV